VERLVEFPHTREAPEHVLGRLRSIEPTAELLYWGPRLSDVEVSPGKTIPILVPVWALGTVRPNGLRRRMGAHILNTQERLGARGDCDTWRYGKLLYQHFAPVVFYPARDPSSAIVEDFRLRDFIYRWGLEEEERRWMLEAEGIPALELRKQTMIDKAQAEGPSLWKFTFGGRRSFSVN
jgi:hypothetical protein